jgi:hypothetical protein
MGPDDGEDACRVLMVAVEDGVRGLEPRVEGDTQRPMGDVTTAVPPPPGHRVEPRAVGRHVPPHQPPRLGADHGLDLLISMGSGVIPRDLESPRGRRVDQGLQPFSDLPAALTASAPHDRCAGRIVDGPKPSRVSGDPGVGLMPCWPRGLHMARHVGRQLRVQASASSNTAPGCSGARVSALGCCGRDRRGPGG